LTSLAGPKWALAEIQFYFSMKIFKKAARIFILSFFIILASFGMGMFGLSFRERFLNKETRIELVEKKKEERQEESEINE
jgi:hypothetical protein